MSVIVAIVGWSCFGLAIVAGLLLDLVGLFGNWVILAAVAALWALSDFQPFGLWGLGGMAALALLGEVLEFLLAGYGAKRFGGSKGAMVAALVGCLVGAVVGTPWFPVLGTVAGACLGAFAAAALYEYLKHQKPAGAAVWTGVGAAVGKIGGMAAKLCCGLAMLAVAALTY
jgi:uncharacterized protein YqgC (DUF456 family)